MPDSAARVVHARVLLPKSRVLVLVPVLAPESFVPVAVLVLVLPESIAPGWW
jgi:hypothetical protein